ncbi:MAG: 23S rRNA (pseudouridine(1915)-N(3))-methyltransferase RlmH [Evtepia sp.]|uniref:23S rRNA (pseudouridine(1915)-N(3))-methyltransferase RlmH n=1 Tax=Evtepia sp. TaxID=2773933 RepID=UPI002A7548DE|nr:23S rRNA (pseudouridine(1915)-N(3))-methyltransferase RlmH [Evtepia sp.]MDY3013803.1 23S rRNA (pseudouridine(1915)-N(3))-methyltransferase RlmH [Evtepia sp.]
MLSIQLLCVGKLKEKHFSAACAEYEKRLNPFCKLSVIELPEERLPDTPSPAQIEAALEKEAAAIFQKLPKGGKLIALCVEGGLLSSEQLASQVRKWTVEGTSSLTLVIGGSFGLHSSVKDRAQLRLSMSPMTFPHHLARVMVLEQLYRCFQINAGTRYHK